MKPSKKKVKTGDKYTDDLYTAVIRYVEKNSGTVVVIGGIALVDEGKKNEYGVMVSVLGKRPIFEKKL